MFLSCVCLCIAFVLKNNGISTFSPSGALWGLSEALWGSLVLSGALWGSLVLFEAFVTITTRFGREEQRIFYAFIFVFVSRTNRPTHFLRIFYAFFHAEPLNR